MKQAELDDWNKAHPIGSPCEVRLSTFDPWISTRLRSEAWFLYHGAAVAKVDGKAGGYLLDFIRFPAQ